MAEFSNAVKTAARSKRTIRGVHLTFSAPKVIDILSGLGLDFIYIDGEHGAFDIHDIAVHCVHAERYGVTPIARIPDNSPATITRFLDRGVRGIVVPHVENAAEARRAADAAYFAPLGDRSYGGAFPQTRDRSELPAFLDACNDAVSVCAMLESRTALAAAEDIAAVDGIDYLSFGMMDLAQSLGHKGDPGHPEVVSAVAAARERINARGKPVREDFMTYAWIADIVFAGARDAVGPAS